MTLTKEKPAVPAKCCDHDYHKYWKMAPGALIYDLGASTGEYEKDFKDEILQNGAKVVCVEPAIQALWGLAEYIRLNMAGNAMIVSCGLSQKKSTLDMYTTDNVWCNTLKGYEQPGANCTPVGYIPIPCLTFPDLFEMTGSREIDFVKADIEGAELDIIDDSDEMMPVKNWAIAAYHVVDGERTGFKLWERLSRKGYNVVHEFYPEEPFKDMIYAWRK